MTTTSNQTKTYCSTCGGLTCYPGNCRYNGGRGAELGTVIEVQFRTETEADRMTGDVGDRFRTDRAQDEFRRRHNVAMERLAR